MDYECCGTCRFHRMSEQNAEWECANEASEYYSDYTPYDFWCIECEERR